MLTQREPTHPVAAPPPDQAHKLIGGHRVRPPPSPPSRSGSSASVVEETGTAYWMRKNGTPKRVRGERAKEISKALTQLLRHAAPRLGIRTQEDGYVDMGDLLRAPRFWNQWITGSRGHRCDPPQPQKAGLRSTSSVDTTTSRATPSAMSGTTWS